MEVTLCKEIWDETTVLSLFTFASLHNDSLDITIFQPFIEQDETIPFTVKGLEAIPSFPAKEEEVVFHGIHMEVFTDDGGEAVDGLAHVGITAGDINPVRPGDIP